MSLRDLSLRIVTHLREGTLPDENDEYFACFYVASLASQITDKDAVHMRLFDGTCGYNVGPIHESWKIRAVVLLGSGLRGTDTVPRDVVQKLDRICTISLPSVQGNTLNVMIYEAGLVDDQCKHCDKRYKSSVNARCCEASHITEFKPLKNCVKIMSTTWNCMTVSERIAFLGPGVTATAQDVWSSRRQYPIKKAVLPLIEALVMPHKCIAPSAIAQAIYVASEGVCILPGISRARHLGVTFGMLDEIAIIAFAVSTRLLAMHVEMDLLGISKTDAMIKKIATDEVFTSLRFIQGSWADAQ